jgi:30S ribosomal protein S31
MMDLRLPATAYKVRARHGYLYVFFIGHLIFNSEVIDMGRGDRRTRKGKIWRGSHGKTRPGRAKKKS